MVGVIKHGCKWGSLEMLTKLRKFMMLSDIGGVLCATCACVCVHVMCM